VSWFDWTLVRENADLFRFTSNAIAFRRAHPALRRRWHVTGNAHGRLFPDVSWHGVHAWTPDWSPHSRLIAVMFHAAGEETGEQSGADDCVYVAANSHWEGHELELPELPDHLAWHGFADTGAEPPHDIAEPGTERPLADQRHVHIGPRSVVVLLAGPREKE